MFTWIFGECGEDEMLRCLQRVFDKDSTYMNEKGSLAEYAGLLIFYPQTCNFSHVPSRKQPSAMLKTETAKYPCRHSCFPHCPRE